jgi:7-cyano-7-deazaguanine tRNA-ribosyltransferase
MAEAKQYAGNMMLAGPVQGSTHLDMREEAARRAYEIGFDVYPLGAVVPLMESYRYSDLVDVIVRSKMGLGPDGVVHLFGAGHPMMLAMAVALGCDLFDSAAYALYAKDGRYMTVDGTYHIGQLQHLPCSCPVCSRYSAKELNGMDEATRMKLLAEHNLYVTFAELRLVKQSIIDGDLMEHVERRCRSHPRMLEGLKRMMDYAPYIERFDRASKSTFFYLGPESARRPEVLQYDRQIQGIEVSGKVLIAAARDVDATGFDRVLGVKMPFGIYPQELNETYPVGHAEVIDTFDADARDMTLERVLAFIKAHPGATFTFAYERRWESPVIAEIAKVAEVRKLF